MQLDERGFDVRIGCIDCDAHGRHTAHGGSCPNIACLPSKNVIYSARVASLARRGAEFGLEMDKLRINMAGVQRRKREMVEAEHQFHAKRTTDAGIELLMGEGRFVATKTVERRPPALSHRRDEAKRGPAVSTDSLQEETVFELPVPFALLDAGKLANKTSFIATRN
jgi:hypothetical protein